MSNMNTIKDTRLNELNYNYQGTAMIIINYNNANDIIVEFQDDYKAKIHSAYKEFSSGHIKNPYYPEVYGVGMYGMKYSSRTNGRDAKEYKIWHSMLQRCYDQKTKDKQPTYKNVSCCKDWLLYDNFYEWVHSQENFDKWYNSKRWTIDKDILHKGNQIYSPENCCLVPENINCLFTKRQNYRGDLPIGVYYYQKGNCYRAQCMNNCGKRLLLGSFNNEIDAFIAYKTYKEQLIKQLALQEYYNNNITEKCYKALLNYIVEITD